MWHSDSWLKTIIIGACLLVIGCSTEISDLRGERYLVTAEENAASERWAEYLCYHLSTRSEDTSIIDFQKGMPPKKMAKGTKNIHIEVAGDLENDYCIKHTSKRLHIRIRENSTAPWMVYQLIDRISMEDHRFRTDDLPPAVIDFSSQCKDFDLVYREPFFAPNLTPEYAPVIGTNCVDTDWGIWGHNLHRIVDAQEDERPYALVDGERNREQLCFSSPLLFERLKAYIIDEGNEQSRRFMIMPNDNDLVCTCQHCKQLGNSEKDATPAVHDLLCRLAEYFPQHQFFTTAYRTTTAPPSYPLPENSGVFFSTVDLPKGVRLDNQPEVERFVEQIASWRYKTRNIYLWDYGANFDDYLTPAPILLGLQAQLQFFKQQGIKGVFLNASGYDYSSFDDVKTFVAGALMMDVNVDVEALVKRYFQKAYPQNHLLLSNYYLSLERRFSDKDKPYDMYGGMRDIIKRYLDMEEFIHFYETVGQVIPSTTGEEQDRLVKLYTALTFTRLQIAYIQGDREYGYAHRENNRITVKPEIELWIEKLRESENWENMDSYKESEGSIVAYISQWEQLLSQGKYENLLLGKRVEILSAHEDGFEMAALLTDGTPGFRQDYHQGWYISSADQLHLRFTVDGIQSARIIRLRFLQMQRHKIALPEEIKVLVDGIVVTDQKMDMDDGICSLPVDISGAATVEIIISCRKNTGTVVALDEVQLL